ncbi:YqeG family HAD IIIA-type phosphatase [Vagococcus humatus]|uniref:YqeG family HAD IIIA-type phosphatase n=1 Tax=Vagococcus humatus TaxID=1889241 RepID=A0A3S0ADU6_9ENTE|nr:YqeG family HAD IIIA-type phosphatase [Vagococcus humatus]RST90453.1 YqeG family HAD IIIA-type phosphatase [Vagococcus humatus]
MLASYKPTWLLETIYQLTPEQLAKHQIHGILTDLDNTLIAWNNPDGTKELHQWMTQMKEAGIPVIVVSNNSRKRVAHAVKPLGLPFVSRAMKPFTKGINEGVAKLNLPKEQVVMVGDQLMTDIKAANTAGVRSIYVKPLVASDAWNTKINRARERRVMKQLTNKYSDIEWSQELK